MYRVGLTGGIGSGKSTVARRLEELGAHVIDADAVARTILAPGSDGLGEVAERFGSDVLDERGELVRQTLADIVFNDDRARADLDAITHPRIAARIASLVAEHERAEVSDGPDVPPRIVVVDHPLLVETGQAKHFPDVIVVVAEVETRVARLVAHRGLREDDARARVAAQATDEERIAASTHVVRNDGTRDDLRGRVDEIHAELVAAASRARETAS